ncbi:MAG TPA: DUF4105 domain-containing protein [Cyclobacteriaceae bacterium]|nr:DUF4105 domain-containing protein [Cyclobacteriaceae bacterium]
MRNILIAVSIFIAATAYSQPKQLSDSSDISVLTLGPYQGELYSAFGHSAMRVTDRTQHFDYIFNWGVFDFDQPNFYLNFARGKNFYMLAAHPADLFIDYYIQHNRFIHEQKLNLTTAQKQKLFEYLLWNVQTENRSYRYDYFYDNCATRVRDVMVKVFGDSVKFDDSYITTDYSIRDLTDIYLKYQPWGDLGIDICLGLPMDKKATPYEYMFLPDYIESSFDRASINGSPIVKEKANVYDSVAEAYNRSLFHPMNVFILIALVALTLSIWDFKRKKLSTWFDAILFGVTGAVGLLLFLLWVATDHKAAANNFNLLWALPTNLIVVISFYKNPSWLKKYFLIAGMIAALTLVLWPILPQQLNYFLVPFVVALLVRSLSQYRLRLRE